MIGGLINTDIGLVDMLVSGGNDFDRSSRTFYSMLDGDRHDAKVMLVHVKMNQLFRGHMQRALAEGRVYSKEVR